MRADALESKVVMKDGYKFRVDVVYDNDSSPWEYEWELIQVRGRKDKAPHHRKIPNSNYVVDMRKMVKQAKKDGWGPPKEFLQRNLNGRNPTAGTLAMLAVESAFKRACRCGDDWSYVGVVVTLLDKKGVSTDIDQSCWGLESDDSEGLKEVEADLISEILEGLKGATCITTVLKDNN